MVLFILCVQEDDSFGGNEGFGAMNGGAFHSDPFKENAFASPAPSATHDPFAPDASSATLGQVSTLTLAF